MSSADWVVVVWCAASSLLYLAWTLKATWGLYSVRTLREVDPPALETWPKLSVIVPACNEAATLRKALTTLLSQDYPDLEIVLVDDRSTDATGEIVDALAQSDARVAAHHVSVLPDGWLGKVNALAQGLERAKGEWVLFTDADVHYRAADLLRRAVSLGEAEQLDHVCLLPKLDAGSFAQEVAVDAFGIAFFTSFSVHELKDPESERYVGVGAFNMVRRRTLDKTEGLEWLRMEVGDDVGLGLLMRKAGGRARLWLATRELSVLWYPSLGEMVRGLEKNLFAVIGHYSVLRAVLRSAVILPLFAGLALGLLLPYAITKLLSVLVLLSIVVTAHAMHRRIDQRFWPGMFVPFGLVLLGYMVLRSTRKCVRAGGIHWRGTHYPLAQLRELQRVKL